MRPLEDASDPNAVSSAPTLNRRRFLLQMEVIAGGFACGALPLAAAGCAARARYVTPTLVGDRLGVPAVSVPAGGLLVEAPGTDLPIYLRKTSSGGYTAVSTRCMHRGCQVEPSPEKLVCPCHGSEYTFAGDVLQGPTERPLVRYRVTTDADMVFIHTAAVETP